MTDRPTLEVLHRHLFGLLLAVATFIVVAKAYVAGQDLHENFAKMGNDDIMRLTVVRDLIAGQSWFDTTQYRLLPPDGLSLHWSRYIDAGIAAIILPLSLVMPMDTAEQLAVAIWPTLIMLITLCLVAFGTRRIFGVAPAIFAMMCLVLWPLTAEVHASVGNIDHHNVQLLLSIGVVFATIWPASEKAAGLAGGLAAAFSLAIGLENLLFIVVAGLVLVVRSALDQPFAARRLVAFCVALGLGSTLFWLGQAPPASRFAFICDQLAPPILSLVWVAVIASVAPLALRLRVSGAVQLGLTIALTVVGLVLIWPMLASCQAGPYGNLPVVLRDYISDSIVEALPAIAYAKDYPAPAIIFTLPVIAALFFGASLWFKERGTPLGILMVFCVVGSALVFYQMRTVIMVAAAVPMIAGVVIARLLADYLAARDLTRGLVAIFATAAFVAPTLFAQVVQPFLPDKSAPATAVAAECRTYAGLQSLNDVPPSVIFTHGNFGGPLIWATHHDALGAPYHRSAAALTNGALAYAMEEPAFRSHVMDTSAEYVLLCRGMSYQSAFLTELAAEATTGWLQPVPLDDPHQILLKVLRE